MITPEQVTQIVETIKTLNLNIDSNTLVEVVGKVNPVIWAVVMKQYVNMFLTFTFWIVFLALLYKVIKVIIDEIQKEGRHNN